MTWSKREDERLYEELGPRAWMWLKAENDPEMGFYLPTLWRYLMPHDMEFA